MSQKPQAHAHKLVYQTAVGIAHELYDNLMSVPAFYAEWKRLNPEATAKQLETRFVKRHVGKCLPQARATLTLMLRGPHDSALKEQIHEALCLDAALVRGRGPSTPIQENGIVLNHQVRG